MSRLLAVVVSLLTAATLAGCASNATPGGRGGGSAGPNSSSASRPPKAQVVHVTEGNDGTSVTLHQGDMLLLELHSTYWKVAKPTGKVLSQIGKVDYAGKPVEARDCVPGAGCGTIQAKFRAEHPGRAQIHATRTTCGEALQCSAKTGSYQLTVVVR